MDTSVDPVLIHQRGHEVAITDVASRESGSFIDGVCKPCGQIVEYNDILACIDKGVHGDRADASGAACHEHAHAPLFEAMLDAVGVAEHVRVLDAGCGGGGASVVAAAQGAVVSGLEASAPLIEIARSRVPDGVFRVGDLETLPFVDSSFDAVIAANSIQYAENRVAALREMDRVSAPEARIAVGLFANPDRVDFRVVFAALRDSLPEPPLGDGPFGLSGPGVLEGLIEQAGSNVIGSSEVEHSFFYQDGETFWKAVISGGPPQAARDIVGEDTLREAVLQAVAPYMTDAGGGTPEQRVPIHHRFVIA